MAVLVASAANAIDTTNPISLITKVARISFFFLRLVCLFVFLGLSAVESIITTLLSLLLTTFSHPGAVDLLFLRLADLLSALSAHYNSSTTSRASLTASLASARAALKDRSAHIARLSHRLARLEQDASGAAALAADNSALDRRNALDREELAHQDEHILALKGTVATLRARVAKLLDAPPRVRVVQSSPSPREDELAQQLKRASDGLAAAEAENARLRERERLHAERKRLYGRDLEARESESDRLRGELAAAAAKAAQEAEALRGELRQVQAELNETFDKGYELEGWWRGQGERLAAAEEQLGASRGELEGARKELGRVREGRGHTAAWHRRRVHGFEKVGAKLSQTRGELAESRKALESKEGFLREWKGQLAEMRGELAKTKEELEEQEGLVNEGREQLESERAAWNAQLEGERRERQLEKEKGAGLKRKPTKPNVRRNV